MTSLHQKDPHNFKQGGTVLVLQVGDELPTHTALPARSHDGSHCMLPADSQYGPPLCYQARTGRRGCTGARRGPHRRAVRRCFLPDSGFSPRGAQFQLGKMVWRMARTTASSASISAWQDGGEDVEDDGELGLGFNLARQQALRRSPVEVDHERGEVLRLRGRA